nr:hypothetical protein [uncultured Carboxylicivirga sp.]
MICGIVAITNEVELLKKCNLIDWKETARINGGEIIELSGETENKGLRFKIIQNKEGEEYAIIRGSLHKEAHGVNSTRFTFHDLCKVIHTMKLQYGINPHTTFLRSFEIQINLFLMFPVSGIIDRCLIHKKVPFSHFSKTDIHFGKIAVHDRYALKFYDKGVEINKNVLRYGIAVLKMEQLKEYSIKTLTDLLDSSKVVLLVQELLMAAKDVIFWDENANTVNLNIRDLERWYQLGKTSYWENVNHKKAEKARKSLKRLSNKLNLSDYNTHLEKWIKYEWKQLFTSSELKAIEPILKMEHLAKGTNAHLYKGCKRPPNKCSIASGDVKTIIQVDNINTLTREPVNEVRFCASCGRDISMQRKGSTYCSAKFVGEEKAKWCRNKARNRKIIQ